MFGKNKLLILEKEIDKLKKSICVHQYVFKRIIHLESGEQAYIWAVGQSRRKVQASDFGIFECTKCGKILERALTEEEKAAINLLSGVQDESTN